LFKISLKISSTSRRTSGGKCRTARHPEFEAHLDAGSPQQLIGDAAHALQQMYVWRTGSIAQTMSPMGSTDSRDGLPMPDSEAAGQAPDSAAT
jgi:hypothetical protein